MILFIDRNFSSVNSQDGKGYFYVQAITKSEENKRKKERKKPKRIEYANEKYLIKTNELIT